MLEGARTAHPGQGAGILGRDLRERAPLLRQAWFLWPLGLRLLSWLFLAHAYEMAVFQDVSWRMVGGEGVYARFSVWLASVGDGYYAYPPLYAYMLWVSGRLAAFWGGHWWLHQLLIKAWLVLAEVSVMVFLQRVRPLAARAYWCSWFVPLVAIGQVQPDLWVGLSVVLALHSALRQRWVAVGLLLAAGGGLKLVPLIILPFLAIHLIQVRNWRAVMRVGAGLVVGTAITWLPYVTLFDDAGSFVEVVRFYGTRPVAGLNILSGLSLLVNAARGAAALFAHPLPWVEATSSLLQRLGLAYPLVTLGAFVVLLITAAVQRWPLWRVFCLPLLMFLLTNKVVHEHYLLQVLPLFLFLGTEYRGLAIAYVAYLLAAGTPLRFFPKEFGLPSTVDALLPASLQPTLGAGITIALMLVAGLAALAFSWQVLKLVRVSVGKPLLEADPSPAT